MNIHPLVVVMDERTMYSTLPAGARVWLSGQHAAFVNHKVGGSIPPALSCNTHLRTMIWAHRCKSSKQKAQGQLKAWYSCNGLTAVINYGI